jgi:hypothetical protein
MKPLLHNRCFTNDDAWIALHGDDMYEAIVIDLGGNTNFHMWEAVEACRDVLETRFNHHEGQFTKYTRAVLRNLQELKEIERIGHTYFWT